MQIKLRVSILTAARTLSAKLLSPHFATPLLAPYLQQISTNSLSRVSPSRAQFIPGASDRPAQSPIPSTAKRSSPVESVNPVSIQFNWFLFWHLSPHSRNVLLVVHRLSILKARFRRGFPRNLPNPTTTFVAPPSANSRQPRRSITAP